MLALTCATSAALLGGLAISYARFVWTHGNGFRRWMRWLAPLWALASFYNAGIWSWAATHDGFLTVPWLRPAAPLVFLIPALVLWNALREDTRRHDQERAAAQALQTLKGRLDAQP